MSKRILLLLLSLSLYSVYSIAQDTGNVQDVSVIIEKDKPLTLPDANRVFQKTQLNPVKPDTSQLVFAYSEPKFSFVRYKPVLSPAELKTDPLAPHSGFVKAGFGNYTSPLLIAGYETRKEGKVYSVLLDHESFLKGPVRGKESGHSVTRLMGLGDFEGSLFRILPSLNYSLRRFGYYGYNATAKSGAVVPEGTYSGKKASFQDIQLGFEVRRKSEGKVELSVQPEFGRSGMSREGQRFNEETRFNLNSKIAYKASEKSNFNADLGFSGAFYQSSDQDQTRTNTYFRPSVSLIEADYSIKLGVNANYTSRLRVFPDIEGTYRLSKSLSISSELNGYVDLNTLQSIQTRNAFLDDSLDLRPSINRFSWKTSVSLKPAPELGFEITPRFGLKLVKNQLLFAHSVADTSRFSIIYEPDFRQVSLGLDARYQIGNKVNAYATFENYSYGTSLQAKAWYLPAFRTLIGMTLKPWKSLAVSLDLASLSGIQAPPVGNGPATTLKPLYDLSLHASYPVNEKFDAWISIENFLSQTQQQFKNYPSLGLQAKIGFIFRF